MKTNCPNCQAALGEHWDEPAAPSEDHVAVLSCLKCGHLGVWDAEALAWRGPNREEMDLLIADETFLENQAFSLALREWRARDREKLCTVLRSRLDRLGVPEVEVAALADEIVDADYHTHPTADDARSMGLTDAQWGEM